MIINSRIKFFVLCQETMSSLVNIDSNWFFDSNSDPDHSSEVSCIEGILKSSPHDFIVREVYEFGQNSLSPTATASFSSNSKKRPRQSSKAPHNDSATSEEDVLEFLTPALWHRFETLATWTSHLPSSIDKTNESFTPITIGNFPTKQMKIDVRHLIPKKFPTLKVSDGESTSSGQTLVVTPDDCIYSSLLAQGMSATDIEAIYRFYKLGAGDELAGRGVRVGSNLSRDARGMCFQILRAALPSLDSKTVEATTISHKQRRLDSRSAKESDGVERQSSEKVMLVHWSKKALHNAALRTQSDATAGQSDRQHPSNQSNQPQDTTLSTADGGTSTGTLYLGFTLMKHNMEQMRAMRQLASAVGISPSDVSVAGVKDKLAVSFQQACLKLHYSASDRGGDSYPVVHTSCDSNSVYVVSDESSLDEIPSSTTSPTQQSTVLITAAMKNWDHTTGFTLPGTRVVDCETFCEQVPPAARPVLARALHALSQYSTAPTRHMVPDTATDVGMNPDNKSGSEFVSERHPFIAINYFYLRSSILNTGELWGNEFDITIRSPKVNSTPVNNSVLLTLTSLPVIDTSCDPNMTIIRDQVQRSLTSIQRYGFPNFYGSQRMGYTVHKKNSVDSVELLMAAGVTRIYMPSKMPSGPLIGRLLLSGQLDAAIHMMVFDSLAAADDSTTITEDADSNAEGTTVNLDNEDQEEDKMEKMETTGNVTANITGEGERPSWQEEQWVEYKQGLFQAQQAYLSLLTGQNAVADEREQLRQVLRALPHSATRARIIVRAMVRFGYSFRKSRERVMNTSIAPSQEAAHSTSSSANSSIQWRIIQQVPHSMRTLWISAYQSWLWNKAAEYRLSGGRIQDPHHSSSNSSREVMVGDLLLESTDADKSRVVTVVSDELLAQWSDTERRTRLAQVVLPLFGTKVIYPTNESGLYYKTLLQSEGVFMEGAGVNANGTEPYSLSRAMTGEMPRGAYRRILVRIKNF